MRHIHNVQNSAAKLHISTYLVAAQVCVQGTSFTTEHGDRLPVLVNSTAMHQCGRATALAITSLKLITASDLGNVTWQAIEKSSF
jgi:hypothetical protein